MWEGKRNEPSLSSECIMSAQLQNNGKKQLYSGHFDLMVLRLVEPFVTPLFIPKASKST